MSLFFLIQWALYSNIVLATTLPQRSERIGNLDTGPISSSYLLPPTILAPSSNNTSSGNKLKIACDSTRYGKNLKVDSCRNIFRYLNKDDTQYTFAERDSGVPLDIPLPLRTFSSETPRRYFRFLGYNAPLVDLFRPSHSDASTTDDGLCFVQTILKKGALFGHASSTEIGQAAFTMLQVCVVERGMGGLAFNLGECPKLRRP